jgi:cob(I)alamin adenosyltransferase
MVARAVLEDETLVAIGALNESLVAHFQKHPGMAQGAIAPVTDDAAAGDFKDFGNLDGHGILGKFAGKTDNSGGSYRLVSWGQATDFPMVRLDKIYTRGGDDGETGLGDGGRVSKASPRIAAMGAVDEANAVLGIARLSASGEMDAMLGRIQNELFDLGADLCVPEDGRKSEGALRVTPAQVARLEAEIDAMNASLAPLTSFILPGGTTLAAHLHMARTTLRRAETHIVALAGEAAVNPAVLQYINRLSDHLFVMARAANAGGDVLWVPGASRKF